MAKRLRLPALVGLASLALGTPLHAEPGTDDAPAVSFSGFGTLAAAHTQGDGAAFIRDLTQPHGIGNRGAYWEQDTRLGIQGNLRLTENVEGVAQIVARYRNNNDFKPELTWGFVKYTFNDMLEVRAGRIGFDAYLAADSRDVGYSYLWARPPIEYYGTLFISYEDGGDIMFRTPLGRGVARAKLYTGITRQQVSSLMDQRQWAGNVTTGSLGSTDDLEKSRVTGGFVDYQDNHWIARLGLARLNHKRGFPPGQFDMPTFLRSQATDNSALSKALIAFADDTVVSDKHMDLKSIALAYEDGPLQTQATVNHLSGNSLLFPDMKSGYVSVGYRIGKFTPYAMIAAVKSRKSQRAEELRQLGANPVVANIANFLISTSLTTQTTYSFGVRYDLATNTALKLQADVVRNKDCSPVSLPMGSTTSCPPPLLWSTVPVNWNGRANIYSAVLDFAF